MKFLSTFLLRAPVLLFALSAGLCLSSVAIAQPPQTAAQPLLLDRAHVFEMHGQMDQAVKVWQQIVLASPNNAQALHGLARAATLDGHEALANTYLDRLHPNTPHPARVAATESTHIQADHSVQLKQANALIQQGEYVQALKIFKAIYGNTPPPGEDALAYYETEAATEGGRAHAVAGLRLLDAKDASHQRYQTALGRILTYDPSTRLEGRKLLAGHPDDPKAVEALRESLLWDAQNPETAAAIQSFLAHHADAQLARALQHAPTQRVPASGKSRLTSTKAEASVLVISANHRVEDENSKALNQGELHAAEMRYRAALALRPSSPEALEGLGDTLLKERQAPAAVPYFKQLVKLQASGARAWRGLFLAELRAGDAIRALRTEQQISPAYRAELAKDPIFLCGLASAYIAVGRGAEAHQVLGDALVLPFAADAKEVETGAQLQYAGLLQQNNQLNQAADLYRRVLAKDHNEASAWRGLVRAEHGMNLDKQAMQTIENMPSASYAQAIQEPVFAATAALLYRSQRHVDVASNPHASPSFQQPSAASSNLLPVRGLAIQPDADPSVTTSNHAAQEERPVLRAGRSAPPETAKRQARSRTSDHSLITAVDLHTALLALDALSAEGGGNMAMTKPGQRVPDVVAPDSLKGITTHSLVGSPPLATQPSQAATQPVVTEAGEIYGAYVPYHSPAVLPGQAGSAAPLHKSPALPEEMDCIPLLDYVPTAALESNISMLPNRAPAQIITLPERSSGSSMSGESKPPLEEYSTPDLQGTQFVSQR